MRMNNLVVLTLNQPPYLHGSDKPRVLGPSAEEASGHLVPFQNIQPLAFVSAARRSIQAKNMDLMPSDGTL
jgi:hypothetical protein